MQTPHARILGLIGSLIPSCVIMMAFANESLAAGSRAPVVLLVSIDGLRADDLQDADRLGLKIPTLRRLMAEGVTAGRMLSVFPSLTYPAHVSLVTGEPPALHGVLNNEIFAPLATGRIDWYYSAKAIRSATLWDIFRKAGRTTAGVAWPVTLDAPIDQNLPEVWDASDFEGTFIARSRAGATRGLVEAAQARFGFEFSLDHIDAHKNLIARHIVLAHRPDLMLLHYSELDKKQHRLGPGDPEVFASLEKTDALLGELLATYAEAGFNVPAGSDQALNTSAPADSAPARAITRPAPPLLVCVVSDHGFLPTDKEFKPNVVLRDAGLIDLDVPSAKIRSWRAKAWVGGGSAAIMLADPLDTDAGEKARAAFARFSGSPDAPIRKILTREEARRLGASNDAFLMLDAGENYTFSNAMEGEVTGKTIVRGMHGQLPDRAGMGAVFIIAGPGVPRGGHLREIRMIDVAPTLAALAGLELAGSTGRVVELPRR